MIRGGRSLAVDRVPADARIVSIHAPARGATCSAQSQAKPVGCFNPRPRERGDTIPLNASDSPRLFQSTPPREGRPLPTKIIGRLQCFNPRPRERGDGLWARDAPSAPRFNPRPRERGDIIHLISYTKDLSFNPRPRERGDPGDHTEC
jgi:hypothetical protein